jgi:hypothetical protein
MTFADIALNDQFVEDHIVYTKLTEATADTPGTAQGPKWRWRATSIFEFAADDEVEHFWRWRVA